MRTIIAADATSQAVVWRFLSWASLAAKVHGQTFGIRPLPLISKPDERPSLSDGSLHQSWADVSDYRVEVIADSDLGELTTS